MQSSRGCRSKSRSVLARWWRFAGAALLVASVQAQTGSWVPALPPTSSPVFTPIAGFPRPGDPGQPQTSCPATRQSGIFAFTDTMGTQDPNDDREYFVACRSDGIHLIDATPATVNSATNVIIPATNQVLFIDEPGWGYLGPRPAGANPSIPENVNVPVYNSLNFDPRGPYCANPPYPYTTKDTTNREAVVYYDAAADRWYIYAVTVLRDGIWVIPLQRGGNGVLIKDPLVTDYWWTASGQLGHLHTIYLDPKRATLWVVDDSNFRVRGVPINPGGTLSNIAVDYQPTYGGNPAPPHDAMPVGDWLLVSINNGLDARIDAFALPITNPSPVAPDRTFASAWMSSLPNQTGAHSSYLDEYAAPEPSLWILSEHTAPPASRKNIERFQFTDAALSRALTPFVQPVGFSSLAATVHHLRGVGRTGFLAQYNDGISLVDLTADGVTAIGSFDTSFLSQPPPGNSIQIIIDTFLGTWDVAPGQDSGLLYASGGTLGGLVFVVKQGQWNRFWHATPFPATAASSWMCPKVINRYGPPHQGTPFILEDGNADRYPTSLGGQAISYRYTLCYSDTEPSTATTGWIPSFVKNTPNTNQGELNLAPGSFTKSTNTVGNPQFYFPDLGVAGKRWYFQLVVEELDAATGQATGRWAASRGTWIGVAP